CNLPIFPATSKPFLILPPFSNFPGNPSFHLTVIDPMSTLCDPTSSCNPDKESGIRIACNSENVSEFALGANGDSGSACSEDLFLSENKGYYDSACKRCRELEAIEPIPMPGDDKYLFPREHEEFAKDEGLKLRVIRYRKSMAKTSGFDVDCPPQHAQFDENLPHAHLSYITGFDHRVRKAALFVIDRYNETKGKNLALLDISKVCAYIGGRVVLFITFEGYNPEKPDNYVETYQAVVSCVHRSNEKVVKIFRRKSDGKVASVQICSIPINSMLST
ncbi:unnamed protein product, partial [Linum tenue]